MNARHDDIPDLLHDIVYAEQNQLMEDAPAQAMMRAIRFGVGDGLPIAELQKRVRDHKQDRFREGVFLAAQLARGEIVLGGGQNGRELRIPLQTLNHHTLTVAGTGSGKTNRAQLVALQVAPRVRGLWLMDCRKAEFAKLKQALERIGVQLAIVRARSMRFNPLQVPVGVEPAEWIPRLADMLVMVLTLPPRASKVLQIVLRRLYDGAGIFAGGKQFPTLFDLFDVVKADKQLNPPARSAILDNLESLFASLGPDVLGYRRGWTTHDLARLPINFVLGGVSEVAQNLIINWLLLAEFNSRVARGVSNRPLDLFVAIDEGQRLLAASSAQNNALADLWPLVRGTGIGVDVAVPTGHGLMPAAMSFSATKFMGRCGSASDYELIGRSMGLSREQLDWVFHHTRPGRFVAQVGDGPWRYPFVLDVPMLQLRSVTDLDREDLGPLAGLEVVSATSEGATETVSATDPARLALTTPGTSSTASPITSTNGPATGHDLAGAHDPITAHEATLGDERDYRFLKTVVDHPLLRSSAYPKLAGVGPQTAIRIRHRLIAGGLLREHRVESAGRGRSAIVLEATPTGVVAVAQHQHKEEGGPSCS